MPHDVPEYYDGCMWIPADNSNVDYDPLPTGQFNGNQAANHFGVDPSEVTQECGWWARSPGFLWEGPFRDEISARRHVMDAWAADPDDGLELPEDMTEEEAAALARGRKTAIDIVSERYEYPDDDDEGFVIRGLGAVHKDVREAIYRWFDKMFGNIDDMIDEGEYEDPGYDTAWDNAAEWISINARDDGIADHFEGEPALENMTLDEFTHALDNLDKEHYRSVRPDLEWNKPEVDEGYEEGGEGDKGFVIRGLGAVHKDATVADIKRLLADGQFAWPGGYPLYFVTEDGGALGFDTVKENWEEIEWAVDNNDNTGGWRVIGVDVNWEDAELFDDHSGHRIESAYAEDDADIPPGGMAKEQWDEYRGLPPEDKGGFVIREDKGGFVIRGLGAAPRHVAGLVLRLKDIAQIGTNMDDADFWLRRSGSDTSVGKLLRDFNPDAIGIYVMRGDRIDPKYLSYVFEHLHGEGYWRQLASGAVVQHITTDMVGNLQLNLED